MKHLRSVTTESVLTPAKAGCYNHPAGECESPPPADAICLLTSARATAEPDFPRLGQRGELRLRNFGSPRTDLLTRKAKRTGDEKNREAISHPVQSFGDGNPGAV